MSCTKLEECRTHSLHVFSSLGEQSKPSKALDDEVMASVSMYSGSNLIASKWKIFQSSRWNCCYSKNYLIVSEMS